MLDFHQPCEQAGFRAGYSTIDHLQVVNQLQEKANECNIPLCFAFVDYEKVFDSIKFELLFEGLKNQSVDEAYLSILRNLYSEVTSVPRLHRDVYLMEMVTKSHDQVQETKRRTEQGWSAFCKLDNIMRDKNVPMRLKRKAFNECIFPVITYGCETWSLSNT